MGNLKGAVMFLRGVLCIGIALVVAVVLPTPGMSQEVNRPVQTIGKANVYLPQENSELHPDRSVASVVDCDVSDDYVISLNVSAASSGLYSVTVAFEGGENRELFERGRLPLTLGSCAKPALGNEVRICFPKSSGARYAKVKIQNECEVTSEQSVLIQSSCEDQPQRSVATFETSPSPQISSGGCY